MNAREITIVLAVVLSIILLVPVLSMSIWGVGMMGPGMTGRGMMGGGFGLLAIILVLASVALLGVLLTRRPPVPDPLDELKQRLARGDVTKEQYEELRQILS